MTSLEVKFLEELGKYLNAKGVKSFLVGGGVRDLLMGSSMQDFDIMLEADAPEILTELYKNQDFHYVCTKPIIFKKYRTAKIRFSDESTAVPNFQIDIDFSSARKEVYTAVAVNPLCSPSNLTEDLARRDFTINSIALSLDDLRAPIDPFNGQADIQAKLIKILHENSFKDDPVRLLRAVRFESRFGYCLESKTENLFNQAIKNSYATYLPVRRAHEELKKALNEKEWKEIINKLIKLDLLRQFSAFFNQACLNLDIDALPAFPLREKIEHISNSLNAEERHQLLVNFNYAS